MMSSPPLGYSTLFFGAFPLDQISPMLGVKLLSKYSNLCDHVYTVSKSYRQIDRRPSYCVITTALVASRGKKMRVSYYASGINWND